MEKYALLAQVQAKPGKEAQVEAFLKSAVRTAEAEPGTVAWYAFKLGGGRFGIYDTFSEESGREAHLNGEIAKALMANAKDLLVGDPQIEKLDVLAVKGAK
jgi:quinol monooxygenase YgiN